MVRLSVWSFFLVLRGLASESDRARVVAGLAVLTQPGVPVGGRDPPLSVGPLGRGNSNLSFRMAVASGLPGTGAVPRLSLASSSEIALVGAGILGPTQLGVPVGVRRLGRVATGYRVSCCPLSLWLFPESRRSGMAVEEVAGRSDLISVLRLG